MPVVFNQFYNLFHFICFIDDDEYYADQPIITDDNQLNMPEFPFISRMVANEKKRAFRRFRRGAVDECCRQPCTFSELRSYCKPV